MRVLLVSKVPAIVRLHDDDVARMAAAGLPQPDRLAAAAAVHEDALATVRGALAHDEVTACRADGLYAIPATAEFDLAVCVGGDGTVFAVHQRLHQTPLLAVNSDPRRSVGHFTRCRAEGAAEALAAYRAGAARLQRLPRLMVSVDGQLAGLILNDGLFTNANPAAMSRYVLRVDQHEEWQASSGLWIATSAGSSAGIHSAGHEAIADPTPALLWRVREPFQPQRRYTLLAESQLPPRFLRVVPTTDAMGLWIDGAHQRLDIPAGSELRVSAAESDLVLVA